MNAIRLRLCCLGIGSLAGGLLLTTPVAAQDYPLAAGTRWTYHLRKEAGAGLHFNGEDGRIAKDGVVDTTMVTHVAGTDQIAGKTYTRVEGMREGKLANADWFALTPNGMIHVKTVDYADQGISELKPPERLLSPTLAPQETWTWQDSQSTKSTKTTVLAPQAITVPAGTYRAIPVRADTRVPNGDQEVLLTLTQWFVPGIGFVKTEVRIEMAGKVLMHNTMTLEKFERAAPKTGP